MTDYNKACIKKSRVNKVLNHKIESQKRQVQVKYENMSYEARQKLRLHQKSIFHPKYIKNDMPANWWSLKQSQVKKDHVLK